METESRASVFFNPAAFCYTQTHHNQPRRTVMLTIQQAQQYLSSIGLAPPEPIIMAWLDMFNDLQDCLDGAGYSGATQVLILSYLIGLYGLSGGNMYISSQSAPSGASRSFRFAELRNAWKGHLNMLRMLDTAGCTNSLIPAAPDKKSAAFIVVKGGC